MQPYKLKIGEQPYEVTIGETDGATTLVTVNGKEYRVEMEMPAKPVVAPVRRPAAAPKSTPAAAPVSRPQSAAAGATKSPLPGTVLQVNVTVGQAVKAADVAIVLEAMKMENNINCGKDGVVKAVYVAKGDNVLEGADLLLVE